MLIKYDRETYKILGYYIGNIKDIKLKYNEDIKELNIQDCSQKDIRAYNEDGSVKTLGEQIKKGILVLQPDEHIKFGTVVKLNPSYEDEKCRLIQRGLIELDESMKLVYDKENKQYRIKQKSIEERRELGLISDDEWNENQIRNRVSEYSQLDGDRFELMEEIMSMLINTIEGGGGDSPFHQKLTKLIEKRKEIKEKYPKV